MRRLGESQVRGQTSSHSSVGMVVHPPPSAVKEATVLRTVVLLLLGMVTEYKVGPATLCVDESPDQFAGVLEDCSQVRLHFLSGGKARKGNAHSLVPERPAGCSDGTEGESLVALDAPMDFCDSYGIGVVGDLVDVAQVVSVQLCWDASRTVLEQGQNQASIGA